MQPIRKKRKSRKELEKEAERLMSQFVKGMDKITERTYMNSNLDHYARKMTARLLYDLVLRVIKKLKDFSDKAAKVEDIQRAVEYVLPPGLFKYAASEGQKEIFLNQCLDLNYLTKLKRRFSTTDEKMEDLIQRKDRDALTRNIIRGNQNVLQRIMPNARFDKFGNKNVSSFIITLIDTMMSELKKKNPKTLTVPELQKFVEEFFPDSLAVHAKSEAQKMLFEHDSKVFDFSPSLPLSSLSEHMVAAKALGEDVTADDIIRRHLLIGQEYQTGINRIVKEIHPKGNLHAKSRKIIGTNLDNLRNMIVRILKEHPERKNITMVQKSVGSLFPPLMKEHANAEGLKMISRYDTGEYDFEKHFRPPKEALLKETAKTFQALDIFQHGVVALCQGILPATTLHRSAVTAMSVELNTLYGMILKKLIESEYYVSSHDVHRIADLVLPRLLAEHAIAEGEKLVQMYEMKAIKFIPHRQGKKKRKS